jgi:3D (Asp-Asp-Asp) domain-containing protein
MRPLNVIATFCFAGGTLVTAMANRRETTAVESHGATAPRGPALSAVVQAPSTPAPVVLAARHEAPAGSVQPAVTASDETLFSNTYYDFPVEQEGAADTPLYTARCELISVVPAPFHDRLCVQGSGRLVSGETVSFGGRDCACAAVCPRTGQRICYEVLDAARFPCGRGAAGRPITPLRTVAVDPTVIPMGELLFIPELVGLRQADGTPHDGCFVAEDKGIKVKGRRIDIFTGDAATRRAWEAAFPSHTGVHVYSGTTRCKRDVERPRRGCDVRHPGHDGGAPLGVPRTGPKGPLPQLPPPQTP